MKNHFFFYLGSSKSSVTGPSKNSVKGMLPLEINNFFIPPCRFPKEFYYSDNSSIAGLIILKFSLGVLIHHIKLLLSSMLFFSFNNTNCSIYINNYLITDLIIVKFCLSVLVHQIKL
ncbi:unnamed protein product [Rotaria sordida]|uniref:Uncharacterized protein n=1 Tax=Rotaria sordida TaxID=392033 RepID=A0A815N1F3_9BILA|nr:unnamed protein product [Rotaria sordida]